MWTILLFGRNCRSKRKAEAHAGDVESAAKRAKTGDKVSSKGRVGISLMSQPLFPTDFKFSNSFY